VWTLDGPGRFHIQYEQVGGNLGAGAVRLDPLLSNLATGKLDLEVKDTAKVPDPKKGPRVFTPGELLRAKALAGDEPVVVRFKVRLVQPSPPVRKGVGKEDGWVAGHGPGDPGLHPQDRLDSTQEQFAAILTARATQQLHRLGIRDAAKGLEGKVVRVTGRVSSYLPSADDPPSGRQYDLVLEDVSQLELVD
jgi:hypothetical protein